MPRFDLNDYVTVQERIVQFWKDHPDGAIRTQLESPSDGFNACRYSAAVYVNREDAQPAATGWAFETVGASGPNATSHEENCETSAIGRALANLGYATSQKDRPSREEMSKPARKDATPIRAMAPPTEQAGDDRTVHQHAMRRLHAVAKEHGISHDQLHAWALSRGLKSLREATAHDMTRLIDSLESGPRVVEQFKAKFPDMVADHTFPEEANDQPTLVDIDDPDLTAAADRVQAAERARR
jgi:hypothetical protein